MICCGNSRLVKPVQVKPQNGTLVEENRKSSENGITGSGSSSLLGLPPRIINVTSKPPGDDIVETVELNEHGPMNKTLGPLRGVLKNGISKMAPISETTQENKSTSEMTALNAHLNSEDGDNLFGTETVSENKQRKKVYSQSHRVL